MSLLVSVPSTSKKAAIRGAAAGALTSARRPDERAPRGILDDAGELEHLVVDDDIDARLQDLDGEQRFGEVLQRVGRAQLEGPQRSGEDDRHARTAEHGDAALAADGEPIGAVDDDDAVMRRRLLAGHARDAIMI